jgi:hypothetical protein
MTTHRALFLTLGAAVAVGIGSLAVALPDVLLASKGVALPNEAAATWVREVGVAIFALGVMMFLVRTHADSPTLRAFFVGNAIVQLGLLPIELRAYHAGVITRASGVIPSSVLHVLLASGFLVFAVTTTTPCKPPPTSISKAAARPR